MTSSSHSHLPETQASSSSSPSHRSGTQASSSSSPSRRPGKEVIETRNWVEDLPRDVAIAILQKVETLDLLRNVQNVCVSWRELCQTPALWRSINLRCHQNFFNMPYDIDKMTKLAIDRSFGQLIDICLEYFWNDDILKYITDRKIQLKCLRLVMCLDITNEGLSEAVKKMPSMEELHIIDGTITNEGLETVGRSCPGLKSLTFNHQGFSTYVLSDSEALAISRTMPGLLHLSLIGNLMTNTGLRAILDGCPHLESLDLRQCSNVNLTADRELGKRCASSIRTLRLPSDSQTDGIEFIPAPFAIFPNEYREIIMGNDTFF